MNKRLWFCMVLLFGQAVMAQKFRLNGKVVIQQPDVSLYGIDIQNITQNIKTTAKHSGTFSIEAQTADTLVFTALHLKKFVYVVQPEDPARKTVFIPMEVYNYQLDDVVVEREINALNLGVLSKKPKTYTLAERRLRAAGTFHWYSPLLIPFGGMSLEGLLNAISGRTKNLKETLEVEKKADFVEAFQQQYDEKYLTEKLKIPIENSNGFAYFLAEEQTFVEAFRKKNKELCELLLLDLSVKYKKQISNE